MCLGSNLTYKYVLDVNFLLRGLTMKKWLNSHPFFKYTLDVFIQVILYVLAVALGASYVVTYGPLN